MHVSVGTLKQSIDGGATFRVRRTPKNPTVRFPQRFSVTFVGGSAPEIVGGGDTLGEAIEFALHHMGAGDTLDVKATI